MMELLYRGFDGLDVSFQGQISTKFAEALDSAKAQAGKSHQREPLEWNGILLAVFETGAKGGYAFSATTGEFGATWFFKRPSLYDPWGVRVSCSSFLLATKGLGGARAYIYAVMAALEIALLPDAESIGRVDYALDYLIPDFTLIPEQFVMHSNARRADHHEIHEIGVSGRSGRVTSVTVGKMPGRQLIVYDKRAEIIAKRKTAWWDIWDATRAKEGLPASSVTALPIARSGGSKSAQVSSTSRHDGEFRLGAIWTPGSVILSVRASTPFAMPRPTGTVTDPAGRKRHYGKPCAGKSATIYSKCTISAIRI